VRDLEESAAAEIESAVAFAEAGTWESVDDLERDVLTPESAR
jgi:pyruvate dehydrogenase E1 component alpha subunit